MRERIKTPPRFPQRLWRVDVIVTHIVVAVRAVRPHDRIFTEVDAREDEKQKRQRERERERRVESQQL